MFCAYFYTDFTKKKPEKQTSSVYSRYIEKYKYFGVFSVFTWIDCQLMKTPQVLCFRLP